MTLEQILKKNGWTDQELADAKPMLENPRFRASLEKEFGELSGHNTKLAADLDHYDKWFTTELTPDYEKVRKERDEASLELAASNARFKKLQELAMRKAGAVTDPEAIAEADRAAAAARATEAAKGNTDMTKYVTVDTLAEAYDKTGDAVANAIDLTSDFMQLFPGKVLNMTQMRLEAKAARQPVRQYVENKYDFEGKRAATAQKAREDELAAARLDERQKVMVEFGSNPNVRIPVASNSPFIVRNKAAAGKQPWERNADELSSDRVNKAFDKAVRRGETANA